MQNRVNSDGSPCILITYLSLSGLRRQFRAVPCLPPHVGDVAHDDEDGGEHGESEDDEAHLEPRHAPRLLHLLLPRGERPRAQTLTQFVFENSQTKMSFHRQRCHLFDSFQANS